MPGDFSKVCDAMCQPPPTLSRWSRTGGIARKHILKTNKKKKSKYVTGRMVGKCQPQLPHFAEADFLGSRFSMIEGSGMGVLFAFKEIFAEPVGLGLKVLFNF